MDSAPASPELEISDKSPPKVLIQQASESDNKSEGNDATEDVQDGATENGESENTAHGESENTAHEGASEVKSVDSQDKVDSAQTGAGLESVEDCQGKSSNTEIVDKDDKEASTGNTPEGSDAVNTTDDAGVQSTSENAENDSDPTKETTEITTGDATIELSRSRTPEIIITPTDDDNPETETTLLENEAAETSNITTTTSEESVAKQSDDGTTNSQDAETPTKQIPDSSTNVDSEAPPVETVEDTINTDKTDGGSSRPTSADRPKSKSPELDPPKNDAQQTSETSKEEGSECESKPLDDSPTEKTVGILELVTNQTIHEEPHPSVSEDPPETVINQDTSEKPPSPFQLKESHNDDQNIENPADATPLGDDITSVTSDEHAGTENPHKDGYDASVSGNEEESSDQPAYTPTVIEKSMREESKPDELSVPADIVETTDVAATSSETLVPSSPATPECIPSRPRSPKSVKFNDNSKVHDDQNVTNDDAKRWEDLRHSAQTPIPNIGNQGDLEMNGDEAPENTSKEESEVKEEISAPSPEPTTSEISTPPLPDNINTEGMCHPKMKESIEELNQEIEKLKSKINDFEEEKSRMIKEKDEKDSQINQMKKDYEKKIENLQTEIEELKNKIKDQQIIMEVQKNEIVIHKNDIDRQKNDIEDYKTKLKKSSSVCVIL